MNPRKSIIFKLVIALIFVSLLLTGILISLRTFNREGNRRQQNLMVNITLDLDSEDDVSATFIEAVSKNSTDSKVILFLKITAIDPAALSLKMAIDVIPVGRVYKVKGKNSPSKNMTLMVSEKIFKIKAGEDTVPIETTFSIDGDLNKYPFDEYEKIISPSLFNSADSKEEIPIGIVIGGGLQGLRLNVTDSKDSDGDLYLLFTITRSRLSLGFSLFIICIMWIISFMMLFLAVWTWLKDLEISAPLLGVPIACLFCLPSIRSSQPGIPPVGALADVIGFFWNMILVALAVVIIFFMFMSKSSRRKDQLTTP